MGLWGEEAWIPLPEVWLAYALKPPHGGWWHNQQIAVDQINPENNRPPLTAFGGIPFCHLFPLYYDPNEHDQKCVSNWAYSGMCLPQIGLTNINFSPFVWRVYTIFRDCGCGCLQETESFSSVRNTPIDTQGSVRKTLLLVKRVHAEEQQVDSVIHHWLQSDLTDFCNWLVLEGLGQRKEGNGEGVCSFTQQSPETIAGALSHYKGLPGVWRE